MMRHDSGKVLSPILKYLLKLLFVCLLLGILYYSFKDSMEDMITELPCSIPQCDSLSPLRRAHHLADRA